MDGYKRFLGSSFLADFTLVISCELPHDNTAAGAGSGSGSCDDAQAARSGNDQQQGGALMRRPRTTSDLPPGTPDHSLSPKTATAAAAGQLSAAAVAAAAAGDSGPCSGQHHSVDAAGDSLAPRAAGGADAGAADRLQQPPPPAAPDALPDVPAVRTGSTPAAVTAAAAAAGAGDIVMPVHGVVLAAASPYFETLLASWASPTRVLHMVVGAEQVAAAQALLGFMYAGSLRAAAAAWAPAAAGGGLAALPPSSAAAAAGTGGGGGGAGGQQVLPQADLLQLLLLADRFDVAAALTAARRALASTSAAALLWPTLLGLWSLPQHVFEGQGEEAASLRGVAWERLLQLFGDLEEAWASADMRALWQQLPLRAISALVASDALAVASENTTFAAVSSWIAHQHVAAQQLAAGAAQQQQQQGVLAAGPPQALSAAELRLLAASIRLPAMGPCFLSYVAMQHDWFASSVDAASLARAAAYAAAPPEVRKDIVTHTAAAAATAAAQAAAVLSAAAAAPGRPGCCSCGSSMPGSSSGGHQGHGGSSADAAGGGGGAAAAAVDAAGSSCLGAWGPSGLGPARCSSCGGRRHSASGSFALTGAAGSALAGALGGSSGAAGGGCGGCGGHHGDASSGGGGSGASAEQLAQLMALAQAMQRPRALSCRRVCQFGWRVDLGSIHALYQEVAAAGSRDSRILRSPPHSFAGYEWALQLEVTQTRGATGFDGTKPWSLGVFLTCQVRMEQLACGNATGGGSGANSSGKAAFVGSSEHADCAGTGAGGSGRLPTQKQHHKQHEQQQQHVPTLTAQLVDFGFVSTSATLAVREAGGARRCEKSWEHAMVRYRASWGWPNYLDVSGVGWDPGMFEKWAADGQLHLTATVRVLG